MTRWWMLVIGLAACGSAPPAPVLSGAGEPKPWVPGGAGEVQPYATDCAAKETFVEAGVSAVEGVIVNCLTGEKIPDAEVHFIAMGDANTASGSATSDASGRYRVQLPEGRYQVIIFGLEDVDMYLPEKIEVRAQHVTVKEIRLDFPRCPPALARPAVAPEADRAALVAAVLDHHAAAGIVDAPPRSDLGPIYVTINGLKALAQPSSTARQYIVTTQADLQREATRSDREIRFINISGLEIGGSCATVTVGGDFVVPRPRDITKMCCCDETEVFLRRGGRWMFRMSGNRICI